MARYTIAFLMVAAVLFAGPGALRADDEKPALSVRMYDIGALTHGRMPFQSQFPPVQDPRSPGDALLLVSSYGPEPVYPLGQADEVIEVLKFSVSPAFWEEREGADVRSQGDTRLFVRATEAVHAELGRALSALETRYAQMVTIEIQSVQLSAAERAALAGTDASRLDPAKVDALLASDATGPALRLLVENATNAEGFGGAQRTFVRSHNVEVAESAQISTAIIGVANPGLAAVVHPTLGMTPRSRVRLALRASLTHGSAFRAQTTVNGDTVELPAHALLDLYDDVLVEPGRWSLVGGVARSAGEASWMLLARVTPCAATVAESAKPVAFDAATGAPAEVDDYKSLVLRMFDARVLGKPLYAAPGTGAFLLDSAAAPRALEEMPEPHAAFPADALVEALMHGTGVRFWEDPATIETRGGIVIVRNTPAIVEATGRMIEKLARALPSVVDTSVTAIEVSDGVARSLTREMAGKGAVMSDGATAILAKALANGEAQAIGEAQVASSGGVRNTVCSGKHVAYLQTYGSSIAQSASRARPVTSQYLAGFEIELEAHPLSGGTSALVQLRLMHTREEGPTRTQNTAHGPVELPSLATARVRTTITVPFGRSAWVASTRAHGRVVVFLATARLQKR